MTIVKKSQKIKFKTNGLGVGKKKLGLSTFYLAIILFYPDPVFFTLVQVFFNIDPIWIPTRVYCALP